MRVLAPVDGSEASERALGFAVDFVRRYEGTLHVVHFTSEETAATEQLLEDVRALLEAEGIPDSPEVSIDVDMEFRPEAAAGEAVLELVEAEGYDHVVMGHHGSGAFDRAILGSATETVIRADRVPVTVIP